MKCCGLQPTERTGGVLRENPGAGLCDRISRARLVTCACPLPAFVRSSPSLCPGCVLPHPQACHMILILDSRIAISRPFRHPRRSATPAHVHPDPSSPRFSLSPPDYFYPPSCAALRFIRKTLTNALHRFSRRAKSRVRAQEPGGGASHVLTSGTCPGLSLWRTITFETPVCAVYASQACLWADRARYLLILTAQRRFRVRGNCRS